VTAALAVSGLVEGPFSFVGFLPRRGGKRKAALKKIAEGADPTILFESPHRIKDTLADLSELMAEREATLCRELTKVHEEVRRAPLAELATQIEWKGEITLVVAGTRGEQTDGEPALDLDAAIVRRLAAGDSVKSIVGELSRHTTLRHRELYARVLGLQKSRG
jgi:16S rRNA (cytidine1402-2'-O)-methyltransferase